MPVDRGVELRAGQRWRPDATGLDWCWDTRLLEVASGTIRFELVGTTYEFDTTEPDMRAWIARHGAVLVEDAHD